jgi:outer membrane protein assembly factor BamD (BamD/ComL family)
VNRSMKTPVSLALPLLVAVAVASATVPVQAQSSADAGLKSAIDASVAKTDAQSADAGAAAATTNSPPQTTPAVPTPRAAGTTKKAQALPPPTAGQLQSLGALKGEVESFERGAKDYRDTVNSVIRLHYEMKKREVLADLDTEIGIEKAELKKARQIAIERLETFVKEYSGTRAHPEATPDAMYRLAALYEERARSEDAVEQLEVAIKPAIDLYKRIIVDFPKYKELAGVYYFLGHAYNDSGRLNEAQQVWRSLVCHNKFAYPTPPDPKKPDTDSIAALPQDHDETFWSAWRARYREARFLKKGGDETSFEDPYPKECVALAQSSTLTGAEPKYLAEVWWQMGNWEFDLLDSPSGVVRDEPGSVYGYNRAASAYTHAMQFKRPPLYGVSLYKYAWTLFKQQRYEAATKEFIKLLNYTDEQQKLTGDSGADFRGEAYTYVAGSLTNVDFVGPGAEEPYIQRPDIIDTEPRREVQEQKLRIAITRVQDPQIIPQDKVWTIDIYKALATEYRTLEQHKNAIEVYEIILKRWPMDPTAPEIQAGIADTYDAMNLSRKPGTPDHDAAASKALEARTALSNYIGNTPWVDANKDNPGALRNAERLVRGGLRQAAVQHTNNGKAALVAAGETGDASRQLDYLVRASSEYKLAGLGWRGFLKQDENAPDAYESRYWLADALRQYVRIQVFLRKLRPAQYGEPTRPEIDDARTAAVDVRDSNEDDKFLDNAAFFVVDISDVDRDLAYQRFDDSKGTQGTAKREEVKFNGEGEKRTVVRDEVPPVVAQSIAGRDEYVSRVPTNLDVQHHAQDYQYYAGETYFLYGQFDLARARFEPMYKEQCGKSPYGYKAWEKLITMSNIERNADLSTKLANEAREKSCAMDEAGKANEGLIVNPTLQEAAFVNARKKFEEAKAAPPGEAKKKLWREAAGLYEAALSAAPGRDEAPEAAMNAAYAYKQVGDFSKAIDLYNKFIAEYGSEDRLTRLQKGDPKTKAGPDLKKYEERLKYLNDAYDALGSTYYSFFNYQRAAETYEKVAANERFDGEKRKVAAKNAMVIYASMAQREKMTAQYRVFNSLKPSIEEKANADYLLATYDYKQWNAKSGDTGQNRQTRVAADAMLSDFYQKNSSNTAASKYDVEATYFIAKMRKSAGEDYTKWLKSTIAAWDRFKSTAPPNKEGRSPALDAPYVDYVAEAEFTLLDEEIHAKYDTDAKHKYEGAVSDVVGKIDPKTGKSVSKGKYQANAEDADKWDKQLERIGRTYPSVEWTPAVIARQGALWDSLRTGLYNTVPPKLKYFTAQDEAKLKMLENSGRPELEEQAGQIRDAVRDGWRTRKEKELTGADTLMVRRYASSVALARRYNIKNASTQRAIARLAYFTDIIGDAKMREYVTQTGDPTDQTGAKKLEYKDGQYVQTRPGQTAVPASNGAPLALPVSP